MNDINLKESSNASLEKIARENAGKWLSLFILGMFTDSLPKKHPQPKIDCECRDCGQKFYEYDYTIPRCPSCGGRAVKMTILPEQQGQCPCEHTSAYM